MSKFTLEVNPSNIFFKKTNEDDICHKRKDDHIPNWDMAC